MQSVSFEKEIKLKGEKFISHVTGRPKGGLQAALSQRNSNQINIATFSDNRKLDIYTISLL